MNRSILSPPSDQENGADTHVGNRPAKRGAIVTTQSQTDANLGFEAKFWAAADALCSNIDSAEYKHIVHGDTFHNDLHPTLGPTPCWSPRRLATGTVAGGC